MHRSSSGTEKSSRVVYFCGSCLAVNPAMRLFHFVTALGLAAAVSVTCRAEEVPAEAPDVTAAAPVLPHKGERRSAVLKQFGEPGKRFAPVGGDSPHHPPITRWDYEGFSVFFEYDHVVDAVVPNRPATIYHRETLAPAS